VLTAGKMDAWLIENHRTFNAQLKVYTPIYSPYTWHLDDIEVLLRDDCMTFMAQKAIKLQEMNLSIEETQIARRIALLFTGEHIFSTLKHLKVHLRTHIYNLKV
jgi:hypothetical protein